MLVTVISGNFTMLKMQQMIMGKLEELVISNQLAVDRMIKAE